MNERCTHKDCHVPGIRIHGYRDKRGFLKRGVTCGNHEYDKPKKERKAQ